MTSDKIREKRRVRRLLKSQQEKQTVKDLESEIIEDSDVVDSMAGDKVEKSYEEEIGGYISPAMMNSHMMPMPTSWDEVDQLEAEREQAEEANDISWKTRDLVGNIIRSSELSPEEKSKKISEVGSGYLKRIKSVSKAVAKSVDPEDLETKALIEKDRRTTSKFEQFTDFVTRAKLTAAAESKLSDSEFALVEEEDGKKVRKYPIHDKAHVRNALARAAQMIEEGGKPAQDARKALPNIKAAAKKLGIGSMEKSRNSIIVQKDASGQWRAVMWPSNNFIDRDGDIFSEKAHKEYVEWVNKNMDCAPVFVTWHKAGTRRENRVDFVGYENGFLIMSAPLTEKEAAGLFRAQIHTDIGMSHGTFVLERNANDPRVIEKYRMVEVSDLPLSKAANPFTDFEVLTKEAAMNTKEYLASILGSEEEAEKYLAKSEMKQKALAGAGIESKEKSEDATEEKPTEAPVDDKPQTKELSGMTPDEIVAHVAKELGIPALAEQFAKLQEETQKVPVLEAVIKDLKESNDEKLAKMIQPKFNTNELPWVKRPSQSKETVLKDTEEDKKLEKSAPSGGWLSDLTKTTPVEA